ncbi:MAG: uncharacterized protein JWP01_1838 [Myxococcales bacterium]|nr:uncharacterized protein [Myxococcales bacterium]
MMKRWLLVALACSSCGREDKPVPKPQATTTTVSPAAQVVDDRYDARALGALSFELSEGTPAARAHFKRGLLALHSFWYDEATREFQAAIVADPSMNMAYWGAAMSRCKLLWGDDDVAAAKELLSRMPDPDRLSPREQTWVVATLELLRAGDVRASRAKFAAAMEAVNAEFPDDESATFLALAVLSAMRPDDPDAIAVRKRSAALALGVFKRNPKHPGAAHYLIHAYDTPELAAEALPFARAYEAIAPAAFHARHMPAHIFSRMGMWKDAITSCQSAWDASVAAAGREKLSRDHHDFHSLSWIVEMNFELGRRKDADAALKVFETAVRSGLGRQFRAAYASQVASYVKRTGDASRIDDLLAALEAPAVEEAAPAAPATGSAARSGQPASHCAPASASSPLALFEHLAVSDARARAASMQRDLAKTKSYIAEMDAANEKLHPFFASTQPADALAKMDAANARRREALLARASGNDRRLLEVLRQSVAADAGAGAAGESNPSGFVVQEEIADTLLRLGQAKEAAAAYDAVLQTHPGRASAVLGAARAESRAKNLTSARARYQQLLELWSAADDGIDGLAEARSAVAAPN